jgi:hypothetical protein
MTLAQMTKRIEKLEQAVIDLREGRITRSGKWWVEHSGQFAGDPVFAEIVRRGRQYRTSLRPKARKSKR